MNQHNCLPGLQHVLFITAGHEWSSYVVKQLQQTEMQIGLNRLIKETKNSSPKALQQTRVLIQYSGTSGWHWLYISLLKAKMIPIKVLVLEFA